VAELVKAQLGADQTGKHIARYITKPHGGK
jgi:hypothetical protein